MQKQNMTHQLYQIITEDNSNYVQILKPTGPLFPNTKNGEYHFLCFRRPRVLQTFYLLSQIHLPDPRWWFPYWIELCCITTYWPVARNRTKRVPCVSQHLIAPCLTNSQPITYDDTLQDIIFPVFSNEDNLLNHL